MTDLESFVAGAAWWEYQQHGEQMTGWDIKLVEKEAQRRINLESEPAVIPAMIDAVARLGRTMAKANRKGR